MKSDSHISKLESIDKDPDGWISHLEGFQIQMNKFGLIQVLNDLPVDYNVILDGLENCLGN